MEKKNGISGFSKLLAFIVLFFSAVTFALGWLFAGSLFGKVINLLTKLALLGAIGIPAYQFVKGLAKGWKILYCILLAIYIVGCVLEITVIK